jgi:hypothetical protein
VTPIPQGNRPSTAACHCVKDITIQDGGLLAGMVAASAGRSSRAIDAERTGNPSN